MHIFGLTIQNPWMSIIGRGTPQNCKICASVPLLEHDVCEGDVQMFGFRVDVMGFHSQNEG